VPNCAACDALCMPCLPRVQYNRALLRGISITQMTVCDAIHVHLHLHLGHLPDAFIQSDLQRVHLLKETAIYHCGS